MISQSKAEAGPPSTETLIGTGAMMSRSPRAIATTKRAIVTAGPISPRSPIRCMLRLQ